MRRIILKELQAFNRNHYTREAVIVMLEDLYQRLAVRYRGAGSYMEEAEEWVKDYMSDK